jgi:acyl-CoA synthetase (AMP-forming)/AMP-acid ligase II
MEDSKSLAQLDGGLQPPYGSSMWSILQNGIDTNPDRAALISVQQPPDHLERLVGRGPVQSPAVRGPDEILTWSYAQMRRGAARLATVLARHGVPLHSTLLSFIPHSAEWTLVLWASAVRCLTVVNQMPQVLRLPEKQTAVHTYFSMMPSTVVVQDEAAAQLVDETRAATKPARTNSEAGPPFLGLCLSRMSEPRHGWVSLADIAEMSFTDSESTVDPSAVDDRLDRVAQIFFTSGSTGTPKGVPKTVKNLAACMAAVRDPKPGSVVGAIIGGNFEAVASSTPYILWNSGNTVVLPSADFSWGAVIRAIETCRVTYIYMMRTQLSMMLENRDFSVEKVASLRRIDISGELVTRDFVSRARELLPGTVVSCAFGMSEVINLFGWPGGVPDPIPNHNGVLSCGKPTPGTRVKIINEKGFVAPFGEMGELHLGSDGTVEQYMHTHPDQKGLNDVFYKDGLGLWLKTGDLAVLDETGCVYIVGRKKHLITNLNGIIQPHLIETCLGEAFNVQVRSYPTTSRKDYFVSRNVC